MSRWGDWLQSRWYDGTPPPKALTPLSCVFQEVVALRRLAYSRGLKRIKRLPVPVIVVGNLTVGGTGKTPLTLWLVDFLRQAGYRPGVISRGYGGRPQATPLAVHADSDPLETGDEPLLLARRAKCPVFVSPNRAEAATALLAANDCDILIADDGLQHYALARDVEIAVVDGERRFGNECCLPAGPLREPLARLAEADLVVSRGQARTGEYALTLSGEEAVNLAEPSRRRPLADFMDTPLHAVAGIGHPQRFFQDLRKAGLHFEEHAFPDHHSFRPQDFAFPGTVLMTEKDAVKCLGFAEARFWHVPLRGQLPPAFGETLLQLLKAKCDGQKTA